jgi:hypothetical protein
MKFTYDRKRKILESPREEVYLKFHGFFSEGQRWVLYYGDKRIGIFMRREKKEGERSKTGEDKADYTITNWLLSVCEPIEDDSGNEKHTWIAPACKFKSSEEQAEILETINDAFSHYDGINEVSSQPVEVRCHPIMERRIALGRLVAK